MVYVLSERLLVYVKDEVVFVWHLWVELGVWVVMESELVMAWFLLLVVTRYSVDVTVCDGSAVGPYSPYL